MQKVLIANRGEIACRIMRTCKRLKISTIAVYSYADRQSLHTRMADQAFLIDETDNVAAYLSIEKILAIAIREKVDGIHPGYGFLAENADFSAACARHQIAFIGPSAEAMRSLGDKNEARTRARALQVPIAAGTPLSNELPQAVREVEEFLKMHGAPVLVKAAAGGGGKGMRLIDGVAAIADSIQRAQREAVKLFGNGDLFLEQYIAPARHVEVQFIADHTQQVGILFDRDCSLQRNNQKILEEAPAPDVPQAVREKLYSYTRALVSGTGYCGAGTAEFLLDDANVPYFLEVNTRIQVEHPITEVVTGVDLVALQIRVAAGEAIVAELPDSPLPGVHAFELRVCAEAADGAFTPSSGRILTFKLPESPAVRVDSGFETGDVFLPYFDSLLAKIIVTGSDRTHAIKSAVSALANTFIAGIDTNCAFLQALLLEQQCIAAPRTSSVASFLKTYSYNALLEKAALQALLYEFYAATSAYELAPLWQLSGSYRIERCYYYKDSCFTVTLKRGDKNTFIGTCGDFSATISRGEFQAKEATVRVTINGEEQEIQFLRVADKVWVTCSDGQFYFLSTQPLQHAATSSGFKKSIRADLPGLVLTVLVQNGQQVLPGEVLAIFESMKMEHEIKAPNAGIVNGIHIRGDQQVNTGDLLFEFAELDS